MAQDKIPFAPSNDVAGDIPFLTDTPGTTTSVPLEPKIVEERASKYDFALGDKSPGVGELMTRIQSNLEESDRQKYAIEKQVELSQTKTTMISDINRIAAEEGRALAPAEVRTIMNLSKTDVSSLRQDPQTFFEREFAKKVMTTAAAMGENNPISGAIVREGDAANNRLDMFENFVSAKEAYQKLAEETHAVAKKQSNLGFAADLGKGLVPFYTWAKMKNLLTQEKGGSFLPGNNLADQIEAAYNGRIEDNLPKVKATIAALQKDNPMLASIFASSLVSYSNASRVVDNILIPVADVASVAFPPAMLVKTGGVGARVASTLMKGVKAVSPELARMDSMLSDIAKAVARPGVRTEEVIDAAGDIKASGSLAVQRKIQDMMTSGGNTDKSWESLAGEIPGFMNPVETIAAGPKSFRSTTFVNTLMSDLEKFRDEGLNALFVDGLKLSKFGPEAVKKAVEQAATRFRTESRPIEQSIMDIKQAPIEEGLGDQKVLITIGDDNAVSFDEMRTAELTAGIYGLDKYQIVPQGNGWAIQLERPLDFSTPFVRQAMKIDAKNGATPLSNRVGQFLTQWRTGEETLPRLILEKMKTASYGMSKMDSLIRDMAKEVGYVKNNKDFKQFLKSQQMAVNPTNPDKLGKFSKTLGEFEIEWASKFDRLPTEQETRAYFHYTMLNDLEYSGINLGLYLDKTNLGLGNLSIAGLSGKVEGKIVTKDSWLKNVGDEDATIMVLDESGEARLVNTKFNVKISDDLRILDYVHDLLDKQGYVASQLSPTGKAQLVEVMGDDLPRKTSIDFVVSRSARMDPLDLRQLPYQPGGHHILPDGFFISQAKLSNIKDVRTKYYGDVNMFYAGNEKMAKDLAAKFEKSRQLYNAAKEAAKLPDPSIPQWRAFQEYVKGNLPIRPSAIMKDFGKNGRLDPNVPIHYRSSNQSLDESMKLDDVYAGSRLIKEKDSMFNLYRGRVNLEYAMKREGPIMELIQKGTPNSPLYGRKFADVIDPLEAMNRSLNTLTRGRNMEPLKLQMAERFVAEFGDLVKNPTLDASRDPFQVLKEGDFIENPSMEQKVRIDQAKAYRGRAMQFLGSDTLDSKIFKHLGEKLLAGNPEAIAGWKESLGESLTKGWWSEKDPVKALQQFAYHTKMGLFSPAQALKQSMTIVHTAGLVGPVNAAKSGVLSIVQRAGLQDWGKLKDVTKDLVKELGLDVDHYEWMTEDLRRIGFGKMGREFANRADHLEANYITNGLGKFLDKGTMFVKMGEEFSRRTAWNAAYMEFLAKSKGKRPTDAQLSVILDRADMLNNNMSNASNASWNSGITAIPTQFWSYQARLTELMTGKRLDIKQKARLFATYGVAFGAPVAVSGATGVWPFHETFKEQQIKSNAGLDDGVGMTVLKKGFLGMVADGFFGEPVDVSSVYGPGGLPFLKDLWDQDKNIVELVGGVNGSVVSNLLMAAIPDIGWVKAASNPNEELTPYTAADFMDVLRPITVVNSLDKMYQAVAVQKYFSKKGEVIKEIENVPRALLEEVIGVKPQAIGDMYATFKVNSQYKDYVRRMSDDVDKSINRMLNSKSIDDKMEHLKAAQIKSLMIPDPLQRIQIFGNAMKKYKTMIERSAEEHARQSPEARDYEARKLRERLGQ